VLLSQEKLAPNATREKCGPVLGLKDRFLDVTNTLIANSPLIFVALYAS
jgi:hypothetical protein